jgi:hypothetical protein
VNFNESGSAIADAAGGATVYVNGPRRNGSTWLIGQAVIRSTAQGGQVPCTAEFYRAAIVSSALLGTSVNADADTMEGLPGDQLAQGDQLIVVFAGCVPGTPCNVNIRGEDVPMSA